MRPSAMFRRAGRVDGSNHSSSQTVASRVRPLLAIGVAVIAILAVLAGCGGGHHRGPAEAQAAARNPGPYRLTVVIKNDIPGAALARRAHGYSPTAENRQACPEVAATQPPANIPSGSRTEYCFQTTKESVRVTSRFAYSIGNDRLWVSVYTSTTSEPKTPRSNDARCSITEPDKPYPSVPEVNGSPQYKQEGSSNDTDNPDALRFEPYGCRIVIDSKYPPVTSTLTVFRKPTEDLYPAKSENAWKQSFNLVNDNCEIQQEGKPQTATCTYANSSSVPTGADFKLASSSAIEENCSQKGVDGRPFTKSLSFTSTTTSEWNIGGELSLSYRKRVIGVGTFTGMLGISAGYRQSWGESHTTTDTRSIAIAFGHGAGFYVAPGFLRVTSDYLVSTLDKYYRIHALTLDLPLTSKAGNVAPEVWRDYMWEIPPASPPELKKQQDLGKPFAYTAEYIRNREAACGDVPVMSAPNGSPPPSNAVVVGSSEGK